MTIIQYDPPQHRCLPPPPRCRTRYLPPFQPPISWRRIPLCRPPNCESIQEGDPNLHVNKQGTLDRIDWLRGWIITQLFTRGYVECDENQIIGQRWRQPPEIVMQRQRLGGWWADAFRGAASVTARGSAFRSGSRLWTLQWNHVTNETLMLAKEYALEAIQYLLGWGIASKIEIEPWYISRRVMRLDIVVRGPGGGDVNVTVQGTAMPDSRYLWAEYKPTPNVDPLSVRYPRSFPSDDAQAA